MRRLFYVSFFILSLSAHANEWQLVFDDAGASAWNTKWFLEGDKASVENSENGMTFSAGPNLREHASHAVLWTKQSFEGDIKVEYDYTRLDENLDAGVNILYIQATGLGTEAAPTDIFLSTEQRREPWMKYYFLNMNSLHVSYATDGRYVSARRYPAADLKDFQTGTQVQPIYRDIDLFSPGETWHITATKIGHRLTFVAERDDEVHEFEWDTSKYPPVDTGRVGFRHMWTRSSQYSNIRVYEKAPQPNIVAIILDDAGWKDVGYHGGDIETPTIDRLAEGGIRLMDFYAYSTCTPSRAAFFSGKAPSELGIVYPIQHDDNYGIPADVETLPEVLQSHGYHTALIGKWHLGVESEFAPLAQGFDYHFGLRGGWTDQYTRENPETGYDWFRDHEIAPREEGHTTDLITKDALRYLENVGGDPFFLCLSYTAPHVPIQVDPDWSAIYEGKYDTNTRQGYAGMMTQIDNSIAQIVEALERKNLFDETLIVFFSDNGPSSPGKKWYIPEDFHEVNFYGNDGHYGDTGDLRGWKASPYNGGVKVPAFLYWQGTLPSESWESPVIIEDLYGIIVNLADGASSVDSDRPLESEDVIRASETFYWRTPRNLALMNNGWKLVLHADTPNTKNASPELYNLAVDPSESVDRAGDYPEQVERLMALLQHEFSKDAEPHVNPNLLDK